MSVVATLDNITRSYGTKTVLDRISLRITAGERIGVVGANGAGKTTLLRTIAGHLDPDSGTVLLASNRRAGYLPQEVSLSSSRPLIEEVMGGAAELLQMRERMVELEREMERAAAASDRQLTHLMQEYGDLEHRFSAEGGYTLRNSALAILSGLGFDAEQLEQSVDTMSGGEKSRAALARLLVTAPDLLLLDEPTNHLDIEGIEWLERFVAEHRGAVLITSHDRYLLGRTVRRVVEVEGTHLTEYRGNYSDYVAAKATGLAQRRKVYELQRAEIERQEEFIRRNIAGQKTKQAQSRRRMLEKLERIERPRERRPIALRFSPQMRGGSDVLELRGLSKRYGQTALFDGIELTLRLGDRIGIVGPNGAGKTTLLRIILGEEEPTAGDVKIGRGIIAGYYDQEMSSLDDEKTLVEELWEVDPTIPSGDLRSILGRFLFTGDEPFRQISSLSGGERGRLLLAKLMLARVNFLILDEPTNHLDIASRTVLEEALGQFPGTILTVSHDRYFLDKVVTQVAFLGNDGALRIYRGNYSHFAGKRAEELRLAQEAERARAKRAKEEERQRAAAAREAARRKLRREPPPRTAQEVEQEIARVEARMNEIAEAIVHSAARADGKNVGILNAEYRTLSSRLERLYLEWERCDWEDGE